MVVVADALLLDVVDLVVRHNLVAHRAPVPLLRGDGLLLGLGQLATAVVVRDEPLPLTVGHVVDLGLRQSATPPTPRRRCPALRTRRSTGLPSPSPKDRLGRQVEHVRDGVQPDVQSMPDKADHNMFESKKEKNGIGVNVYLMQFCLAQNGGFQVAWHVVVAFDGAVVLLVPFLRAGNGGVKVAFGVAST